MTQIPPFHRNSFPVAGNVDCWQFTGGVLPQKLPSMEAAAFLKFCLLPWGCLYLLTAQMLRLQRPGPLGSLGYLSEGPPLPQSSLLDQMRPLLGLPHTPTLLFTPFCFHHSLRGVDSAVIFSKLSPDSKPFSWGEKIYENISVYYCHLSSWVESST